MTDASESIFGSLPAPRAGDVLFGPSKEDWPLNACTSHWGEVNYAYKAGFRTAAYQLAEKMCERPVHQDLVVYPILYLYRHHVELVLKDVFRMAADLLARRVSSVEQKALGRHDLAKLWAMIRPMLASVCELAGEDPIPTDDLEGIDAYMRQLDAYDRNGESFRYSRTRDAKRTLPPEVVHINIRTFAIHMEKLADYLGGLESWIGQLLDHRNEICSA